MKLYTLYLPMRTNTGTPIPSTYCNTVLSWVLDVAGGATVSPEQLGYWQHDGTLYHEPVRTISVLADDSHSGDLRAIAATIARDLDQLSVLLTESPVGAQFVTATPTTADLHVAA